MQRRWQYRWIMATLATLSVTPHAQAGEMQLPDIRTQPTPQAVLDEHLDALNKCDWNRLVAQYPEDAQIHLLNGTIITGRKADRRTVRRVLQGPKGRWPKRTQFQGRPEHVDWGYVCDALGCFCSLPRRTIQRFGRLHYQGRADAGHGDDLRWLRLKNEKMICK